MPKPEVAAEDKAIDGEAARRGFLEITENRFDLLQATCHKQHECVTAGLLACGLSGKECLGFGSQVKRWLLTLMMLAFLGRSGKQACG